jgi:hypothetical protein
VVARSRNDRTRSLPVRLIPDKSYATESLADHHRVRRVEDHDPPALKYDDNAEHLLQNSQKFFSFDRMVSHWRLAAAGYPVVAVLVLTPPG